MSPPSVPPALLDYHRGNNRASAGLGAHFHGHRQRLTDLIATSGGEGGTLALLGAGNGNDVDLERLAATFASINLVDLDAEALERARQTVRPEAAARVKLTAPVDLSGVFGELARWRGKPLPPERLGALPAEAVGRVLAALPERFDTVVSCCLLSQLMHSCYLALGAHPQLEAIGTAVALAHLRSSVALARPGGRVIIATDTVSSESYPLEELWGQRPPAELLSHLEAAGNVLTGTAPSLVRSTLTAGDLPLARAPRLIEPWLWRLDANLSFLVYAFVVSVRG